jgi:3',5'-cyclic AMP phosphodiesterase CpdA
MSVITIAHVSDLHYSQKNQNNAKIIIHALLNDLAKVRDEYALIPDMVIFSGDLVYSGETPEEFQKAHDAS